MGALLAVPMSLFFKAVLVEIDPDARWLDPLISGRPDDQPASRRHGAVDRVAARPDLVGLLVAYYAFPVNGMTLAWSS